MKKFWILLGAVLLAVLSPVGVAFAAAESAAIATYYPRGSEIAVPPTVVTRLSSELDLSAFSGRVSGTMVRPSHLIVRIDGDRNAVGKEGTSFGPFKAFYESYCSTKIIPLIEIGTEAEAETLIAFLKEELWQDVGVVSGQDALLKSVREAYPAVRGVLDLRGEDLSGVSGGAVAVRANLCSAQTVLLSAGQACEALVFEIQARFKSVWAEPESSDDFSVCAAIASGVYGIVAQDYANVFHLFTTFGAGSITRRFYNIGHRGLPEKVAENTLESCIAAYEAGATHVEIDAKICASGEIVIMHDDGVDTTTDGTGSVYAKTLSELKALNVVRSSGVSGTVVPGKVPTLKEILEYFKDKDIVIIVEIKNEQANFTAAFRALLEECDAWEQVVSISFSRSQLNRMRTDIPEIPTADLNSPSRDSFLGDLALLNGTNTAADPSKSAVAGNSYMTYNLVNRGFMMFYWTQYTAADTQSAVSAGCTGITTNHADVLGGYIDQILPSDSLTAASEAELTQGEFQLSVKTYDGTVRSALGTVFAYRITDGEAEAILCVSENGILRYFEPVKIEIKGEEPDQPVTPPGDTTDPDPKPDPAPQPSGCGSEMSAFCGTVVAALLSIGFAIIFIQKGEKR